MASSNEAYAIPSYDLAQPNGRLKGRSCKVDISIMETTAQAIVAPGKGILAADESTGTIKKRFDTINLASTEETRRSYAAAVYDAQSREVRQRRHSV